MVRSRTFIATPPGATIKEQLVDRNMSQKEFAARMNMSEKHISRLINGDVQLTPDVAMRLEFVLSVPASFWNNLEAIYREKLEKIKTENSLGNDLNLINNIPYNEMVNLGWIDKTNDKKQKIINLRKYFEVVELSLLADKQLTNIACRRLAITDKSDFTLMAWAQMVKIKSREIETAQINIAKLKEHFDEIRAMTTQEPRMFCERLKTIMAECGIALVFLPHLKGSFLQGATFIDGNKIVIGMTTRGKDADKFWFSLFHEIGHIVLKHLEKVEGTSDSDEADADKFASEYLISNEELKQFVENNNISEHSIINFAKKINIAPGIVVGRLQKEGFIRHNMFNGLKEKYDIVV